MSENKVAIVTGGASGIGLAIAKKFITENITTIIIGRDEQKLQDAKENLGSLCVPISFDLNDLAGIPSLVNGEKDEFGGIDILVNNAGINQKKEFTEVTDEEFQRLVVTNVTAALALSREVVTRIRDNGSRPITILSP